MLDMSRWMSPRRRNPIKKNQRLGMECLEDRTVPALITYDAATDTLLLTGDAGDSDNVSITAPAPNQVLIQVANGDAITLAGDAVGHADFVLSGDQKSLTIDTEPGAHSLIAQLTAQLGDHNDTLTLGLASVPHGVGHVTIDGQDGTDTVNLNALTLPGNLTVSSDGITVNQDVAVTGSGAIALTADSTITLANESGLFSVDGNITLEANQGMTPATGNSTGIRLINADISTVNGDILLKGRGGNDAATALHSGISLSLGSTITSTGVGPDAGTITLVGTGGTGTNQNYGVFVDGAGGKVAAVDGNIDITGIAGTGSGQFNIGVMIHNGSQVISTGTASLTISGTGGTGTDYNYGVDVQGANSLVTSEKGAIQITGIGGQGSGQQNVGVAVLSGGKVSSTGAGPDAATLTIIGTGGTGGTKFNVGVHVSGAASSLATVAGALNVTGTAHSTGQSQHGIMVSGASIVVSGDAPLTMTGTAPQVQGAAGDGILFLAGASLQSPGNGVVNLHGTSADSTMPDIEWVDLTLAKTGGTITFHGKVRGQTLDVQAGAYTLVFLDGGDVVGPVSFLNTSGVTFGDAADDVINFHGGVTSTASPTTIHGKLQTSHDDIHLGSVTLYDAMLNAGNATIYLTGDVVWTPSAVGGTVFGTLDLGGARTFDVADGLAEFDLTLNGSLVNGSLIKNGEGTLQLRSGGTYEGGTTVNQGTLRVHNPTGSATGTGPVLVNGGSLSGGGTISGPVQILSGIVSPGDTPALTRFGNVTLAPGVAFHAVINSPYTQPGVDSDGLLVTGTVHLNGASLVLSGGAVAPPKAFVWLVQNDGNDPVQGTFAGLPEGSQVSVGQFVGRLTYKGGDGNDVVITIGNYVNHTDQQVDPASVQKVVAYNVPVGWKPIVRVIDPTTKAKLFQIQPYARGFRGGIRVAVGDVDGDGVYDIVTVPGQGASANLVKVYSGRSGKLIGQFRAPRGLMGKSGVSLAVGEIDGDGRADIVLGSGRGAKAKVFVINGSTLKAMKSYSVTGKRTGGVNVRLFDLNGDGKMEIVT